MPYESLRTKILNHLFGDTGTLIYQNNPSVTLPTTPLVGTLDGTIVADPIYTGILQGGIYDRPIKYDGDAKTQYAFYRTVRGGAIRACASIGSPPRDPHTQGAFMGAYTGVTRITVYAGRSRDGNDRIEQACLRIRQLMHGWVFQSAEGPWVFPEFEGFVEPYDTEEFVGAKATYCRIRMTGRYANDL